MNEEVTAVVASAVESSETEEGWKRHLAYAKKFLGSDAEYCRRNRLDPKVFRIYKKKYSRAERRSSVFMKLEREEATLTATRPPREELRLPDPRWTAEFVAALAAWRR